MNLVIVRHSLTMSPAALTALKQLAGEIEVISTAELRNWLTNGHYFKKIMVFKKIIVYTPDYQLVKDSWPLLGLARLLGRHIWGLDNTGALKRQNFMCFGRTLMNWGRDYLTAPAYLRALDKELASLEAIALQKQKPQLNENGLVAYLRPDLICDLKAGGSVAHISGVANNFGAFGYQPIFFSVEKLPLLKTDFYGIKPLDHKYWNLDGLAQISFSPYFSDQAEKHLDSLKKTVSFIYQRHGLGAWTGARLALKRKWPFVLEYNGSEVWIARNWGQPLRREELALRVENLSFAAADLIVAVSRALADELENRGVPAEKILVNPNGVDLDIYHPEIDGTGVRERFGLKNRVVIGFIGTFGRWHGAEKLAEAWGRLISRRPDLPGKTALLMVGDGLTRLATEETLKAQHAEAIFTGVVPQEEGPRYLAACDILVAPHVPNADGSPFFGSPTKLFEYMAMGRAIAASNLDQLGQVIEEGRTGLLARPGDAEDLSQVLEKLVDDSALRSRLALEARKEAVAKHGWGDHTGRIVEALRKRAEV